MSRQNPLFNGLKSVWRVGQTASILAQAGLRYRLQQPPTAQFVRETFEQLGATYTIMADGFGDRKVFGFI